MANKLLLVDGNYLFFLCRDLGISQDFAKIEARLSEVIHAGEDFDRKIFYTRPPKFDSAKTVITWLRAHGWETHLYRYEQVSQDVLYNAMAVEILSSVFEGGDTHITVVSGSGTLIPVLARLKGRSNVQVALIGTEESTSEIVKNMEHISRVDLNSVMSGD